MREFTKPPTPGEYTVLVVSTAIGCVVLGAIAIIAAWRAPAAKQELADRAMMAGFCLVGIGLLVGFAYWLFRRIT